MVNEIRKIRLEILIKIGRIGDKREILKMLIESWTDSFVKHYRIERLFLRLVHFVS